MKKPVPEATPRPLSARWPGLPWLYLPLAVVLAATLLAGTVPALARTLAPRGFLPLSPEFLAWVLIGALASLHRPFPTAGRQTVGRATAGRTAMRRSVRRTAVRRTGSATLGLGTLVLAPAAGRLGTVPAVWVACLAFLLAEACRAFLARWGGAADEKLAGAGGAPHGGAARHAIWVRLAAPAGATLAGAAALAANAPAAGTTPGAAAGGSAGPLVSPPDDLAALAAGSAWPIAAYAVGFAALYLTGLELERRCGGWVAARWSLRRWSPLALDAGGWVLGLALLRALAVLGLGETLLLAAAFAGLAAEAARHALLRQLTESRAAKLERVQQAHARILGEASDLRGIAHQILSECRRVLPLEWFQLELIDGAGRYGDAAGPPSWAAGPDGVLYQGLPEPPARPQTLPGIHRRVDWRVLERSLEGEGRVLAVVRLWCDPRRVRAGAEELFSSLVPQMASSVHRAHLEREAHLDPLTEVPLRRSLESRLASAYRQVCEDGGTMAVIMCDLDFFKSINDTYGHAAGDQALIEVARTLEEHRRETDFCCRYGGEEFALLLERLNGEAALQLAERLRGAVEAIELVHEGRRIPLTLSAGVAAFPEVHVRAPGELLELADEALYQAKEHGRNRCLLNVGQGRFRDVAGASMRSAAAAESRIPRIFG